MPWILKTFWSNRIRCISCNDFSHLFVLFSWLVNSLVWMFLQQRPSDGFVCFWIHARFGDAYTDPVSLWGKHEIVKCSNLWISSANSPRTQETLAFSDTDNSWANELHIFEQAPVILHVRCFHSFVDYLVTCACCQESLSSQKSCWLSICLGKIRSLSPLRELAARIRVTMCFNIAASW
jgi:hypothetical protein